MDISQIINWLAQHKDTISTLGVIVTIIATIGGGILLVLKKTQKKDLSPSHTKTINYSVHGNQTIAPTNINGDQHIHQGLSPDDVLKIAEKLVEKHVDSFATERMDKDVQVKSFQETIHVLIKQNASQYDIQQALDLLTHGNTEKAEEIFDDIATEKRYKGKEANKKKAEALRHLGLLAFSHDTQKAFNAYKLSTELDPDNLDGWNQLGHLCRIIGELENAKNAYMTALKLSCSDREGQAVVYDDLGNVHYICGDLNEAIGYYEEALAIYKALDHKEGMARTYGNLGNVYSIHGDLDMAIEYWKESIALST